MNKDKVWIKQMLEQDVESISFTKNMQSAVLAKVAKDIPFWNRKFTLRFPKLAVALVLIIMIGSTAIFSIGFPDAAEYKDTKDQLIYLSTGVYTKSELQQLNKHINGID